MRDYKNLGLGEASGVKDKNHPLGVWADKQNLQTGF